MKKLLPIIFLLTSCVDNQPVIENVNEVMTEYIKEDRARRDSIFDAQTNLISFALLRTLQNEERITEINKSVDTVYVNVTDKEGNEKQIELLIWKD